MHPIMLHYHIIFVHTYSIAPSSSRRLQCINFVQRRIAVGCANPIWSTCPDFADELIYQTLNEMLGSILHHSHHSSQFSRQGNSGSFSLRTDNYVSVSRQKAGHCRVHQPAHHQRSHKATSLQTI
ncbi:mitochondrial 40S ribosomal protein MRP2 [Histoplasma capsulatum var. duboisii H88]|uniref:Mitochondrial 40S ribosomal protein MRP2 n=1 Tax=Ajellomyces capsulatus (strain H88) TaxID=544711 RepID=A0A8A1LBA9_AJEC8|nr:mitochondrial 40S ribosomal protein MRP2 [Histoplasma capsulatum var. duboisii H88]